MRSPLSIKGLKFLLTVADTGNMTDAARILGVTQSAVSQAIQQIEREVGTPLFHRAHRPLRLTAGGVAMVSRASRLISEAEQIIAATRVTATVPELRIGLIDSFAGVIGPHIARLCMERVANLTLWSGLTVKLKQDFLNRNVDLVVCAEEIASNEDLRQIVLFQEPFILAVPKSAVSGSLSLETLSRSEPMVRYSARSHTGMQIDRHLSRLGLRPTRRLEMDTSESVFPMVAEGVGWAITTPLCVFHGRPDLDHIELLPLPGPKFSRQVVLAHRRGEYDDLADNIAQMTWSAIEAQILPAVRRTIPHALPDMTFDRGEVPAMTGPYRRPVFRRVL